MDKLESYLDQVCRGIGGPRDMRQHIRQELGEHLRDAVARYRAAGLPEEQAVERALADFGGPDEVRAELEATHGHRLMPVVIDKALEWKERTLKAKWLWTTWAYLAVVLVIVLEALFLCFNVVFIIPKFQKLTHDGIIDPIAIKESPVAWIPTFLNELMYITGHYTTHILLLAAAAVGLFEWRVKSENKPFIRLSLLGTVAVALMVVVALTAGSLVVSVGVGAPSVWRMARPFAIDQIARIDTSVAAIEQALAKKDWKTMQEQAKQASLALTHLSVGPAVASLREGNEQARVEELRDHLKSASEHFQEVRDAIGEKNAEQVKSSLKQFHQEYEPLRKAAKRVK